MATTFSPTQGELALVNQIFNKHDPQKFAVITGDVAVRIFGAANLSANVLGQIWAIADEDNQGFLTRKGVSVAVRLMGWAQKGETISADLVNKPGPVAHLTGYSSPSEPRRAVSPPPKSPASSRFPPPLSAQDKAKFTRYFNSCNPVNGLVSGEQAREVFVRSKLPVEKLSQIWNLSDTQNRGSLDVSDFIVAMYLIQASMSGQLPFIPTTLPPGLYEMASDQPVPGGAVALHTTGNSGSLSPAFPTNFPPNSGSVVQPQTTGKLLQPQYSGKPLHRQITGQSSQHLTGPTSGSARNTPLLGPFHAASFLSQSQLAWDVTPAEKASSDKHFDGLDNKKRGYVESNAVVPFMLQSKLPEGDLAAIWDLADLNNDGRLTRDGFAVAFHLIQGRLNGNEIPTTLPPSLMPPSMRAVAAPTSPSFQQPPSESLNDLIWDDSPVASHTQSSILQPQRTGPPTQSPAIPPPQTQQGAFAPSRGLLDDDDDAGIGVSSTTINDRSAEIGNLQNQLQSTTRSLENTTAERTNVEATVRDQAAQLSALQTQLVSAKAGYETESRLLSTLRERFSNQSSEIQKVKEELIRAESDLSAIRVEKAEVEQGVLRDKEEVRELQRKMTETGSTIEVTKAEIDKAKKEAKQQKGLLAIAKKQLAAREAERAKVAQELLEAAAEVEDATKEREIAEAELARESTAVTSANGRPFAPSPSLSADSVTFSAAQPLPGSPGSPSSNSGSTAAKSNNPFERLAAGSSPQAPFLPFANTSVPTPPAVPPTQNEGTTTDNPFTFEQAFGEETRPGTDVQEHTTGPEMNGQPFSANAVGEPRIGANEEVSEPSSDHDLFMTPPTSALDTSANTSANTSTMEAAIKNIPPLNSTPVALSTDRSLDAHTDIDTQLKELDVHESDSSDEDSEDETPLATLVGRPPPTSNRDEAMKETPVSNGHALTKPTTETPFPLVTGVAPAVEVQSTNPFPPTPAKDTSPFAVSTSPFTASSETPKAATVSDFDRAFSDFPSTAPTAAGNLSFDTAFDDQFDFAKADTTASPPAEGVPSSASTAFPPPPSTSGVVKPLTTTPRDSGFENAFIPQQSTQGPARPAPAVDGFPVLPPVPESKPFSFDQAFGSTFPATPPPAATTQAATSQPPTSADTASSSLGDAFSLDLSQKSSAFGTVSSRGSSIPQVTQSPVSAFASDSPIRGSASPRDPAVSFPVSQPPPPGSPPLRMTSPKGRPSTSSSKEGGKEQARHSKLSIRLPFGRKKKTQDSLPPTQHLTPITDENLGTASPAVDDDVEPVKQLCSMGFSRTQAVAALEASSYDFSKALNSLVRSA